MPERVGRHLAVDACCTEPILEPALELADAQGLARGTGEKGARRVRQLLPPPQVPLERTDDLRSDVADLDGASLGTDGGRPGLQVDVANRQAEGLATRRDSCARMSGVRKLWISGPSACARILGNTRVRSLPFPGTVIFRVGGRGIGGG